MDNFEEFRKINETSNQMFSVGVDGVKKILSPIDGKSEFIFLENKILVNINSNSGMQSLYYYPQTKFKPKAKAVLMDLDGTSVKSESFWIWIIERSMQELFCNRNFLLENEDFSFVSGFSVSEHLQYCINKYGENELLEDARELYFKITSYEMNEILCGRGKKDAFTPVEGLKEVLVTLKNEGIKIGLVTSGLYEKAMPEIISAFTQLGMGDPVDFYDAIITAGTTFNSRNCGTLGEMSAKPHPWLYAETSKVGLGISREENHKVIGIEDSSAGVLSLKLAGFEVIGVDDGNVSEAGLDGLLYKKVRNIKDILELVLE